MSMGQIIISVIFLALSVASFIISYFQFREKGYLFNNAYLWASSGERKEMDEHKEKKKPYYRQSGFVFLFLGIICIMETVYAVTDWVWLAAAYWIVIILTVVYAIASSVQIERNKA